MQDEKRWWLFPRKNEQARGRLFCFPHAGAGGVVFHPWSRHLPQTIQVVAAHPPGRGFRIREPSFETIQDYVDTYYQQLLPLLDRPFALFGHSMGTIIAILIAQRLQDKNQPTPQVVFVSGRKPLHQSTVTRPIHNVPPDQFLQALEERYGPDEALQNPDIVELALPVLRADMKAIETFQYQPAPALSCPLVLLTGRDDSVASPTDMSGWDDYTTASTSHHVMEGGHFYFVPNPEPLTRHIAAYFQP